MPFVINCLLFWLLALSLPLGRFGGADAFLNLAPQKTNHMSINVALLKKICETPGVPGHEQKVRELITKQLTGVVDSIKVDNMGNLIALKKGKSDTKKVMAAAHMDEIGFIISHIDDNGFLRFHPLGGFDPHSV